MRLVLLLIGIIMVVFTIVDLIWTSLWVEGKDGPIVDRMAALLWRLLFWLTSRKKQMLTVAGPIILIFSLVTWILLIWVGWALIFAGSPSSIINTTDGRPITWVDYVYYSGYAIFTLGIGDFSPSPGIWQIITSLASGTGMLFLALGASYVISVIGAVVKKRAFASSVAGFGDTSAEILKRAWNGRDFSRMDLMLSTLSTDLSTLTQQHRAYPQLHYYHTPRRLQADEAMMPILDDVLSVVAFGVEEKVQPNPLLLHNLRSSVEEYLDAVVPDVLVKKPQKELPLPELNLLRTHGVPVVNDEIFKERMAKERERRMDLAGLLASDTWL